MNDLSSFGPSPADRRRWIAGAVVLALGVLALMLWPTGPRALASASSEIAATRARYCAIYARLRDATPPSTADLRSPGERIVLPGYVFLDAADISHPRADSNADAIQMGELAALCGDTGTGESGAHVFSSVFADLGVDPESRVAEGYEAGGVAMALEVVRRVRYLVVLRIGRHARTQVTEGGELQPGEVEGALAIVRLADGEAFGEMPFRIRAPGFASLWVSHGAREAEPARVLAPQGAYGSARSARTGATGAGEPIDELSSAADANATVFFQDVLVRHVAARGVELVIRE